MLVVPTHPLLLSAFVLADSALPHGSAYRIPGGYVVPRASHRAVTGSTCLGRERLMEQPVSSGQTSSCETETHAIFRSHEDVLGQIDAQQLDAHDGLYSFVGQVVLVLPRPLVEDFYVHPPKVGRGHSTISVHGLPPMSKIGVHFERSRLRPYIRLFMCLPSARAIMEVCALVPHRPPGFLTQPPDISGSPSAGPTGSPCLPLLAPSWTV
jgi:hypothetical protein